MEMSTQTLLIVTLLLTTTAYIGGASLGDYNPTDGITDDTYDTNESSDATFNFEAEQELEDYTSRILYASSLDVQNPLINFQKYSYIINNENICNDDITDMYVLALIKTSPERYMERQDIRKTWGSVKSYNGATISPVFIMGRNEQKNKPKLDNSELSKEAIQYGDLIQGDFIDHFKNQTYKTIFGMSWAKQYCPKARFILNTNDDTMVDPYHLITFLQKKSNEGSLENFLYCSTLTNQGPVRNTGDKMFVTLNDYPYTTFPSHCEGFAYIMSKGVSDRLLAAAAEVPALWLDDVYTTGMLPLKADITQTDMEQEHAYSFMRKGQLNNNIETSMFLVAKYTTLRKNWDDAWDAIVKNKI